MNDNYYVSLIELNEKNNRKNMSVFTKSDDVNRVPEYIEKWLGVTGKNGSIVSSSLLLPKDEELLLSIIRDSGIYFSDSEGVKYAQKESI